MRKTSFLARLLQSQRDVAADKVCRQFTKMSRHVVKGVGRYLGVTPEGKTVPATRAEFEAFRGPKELIREKQHA